jgi:hypothetical protein
LHALPFEVSRSELALDLRVPDFRWTAIPSHLRCIIVPTPCILSNPVGIGIISAVFYEPVVPCLASLVAKYRIQPRLCGPCGIESNRESEFREDLFLLRSVADY